MEAKDHTTLITENALFSPSSKAKRYKYNAIMLNDNYQYYVCTYV